MPKKQRGIVDNGKLCERAKKNEYQARGCITAPTGRGSDFVAFCPNSKPALVEVKKGRGSLSKLQRETRDNASANGYDYIVERCGWSRRRK
jgi:hypothetical protein